MTNKKLPHIIKQLKVLCFAIEDLVCEQLIQSFYSFLLPYQRNLVYLKMKSEERFSNNCFRFPLSKLPRRYVCH